MKPILCLVFCPHLKTRGPQKEVFIWVSIDLFKQGVMGWGEVNFNKWRGPESRLRMGKISGLDKDRLSRSYWCPRKDHSRIRVLLETA